MVLRPNAKIGRLDMLGVDMQVLPMNGVDHSAMRERVTSFSVK